MISVVIPVYNTVRYLRQCLDSVISQTYSDLEILIVDDGSTDGSADICDEYEKRDKRISVFHVENSGPSAARNVGIENACGEFIMFVDSDDYVDLLLCERMVHVQSKDNSDLVICAHWNVSSKETIAKQIYGEDEFFDGSTYREDILIRTLGPICKKGTTPFQLDILTPVWARLYKTEIIKENDIRFIDLSLLPSECQQFNFEYAVAAKNASYIESPLYFYRRNTISSITKPYRENLFGKWKWWCEYENKFIAAKCESEDVRKGYYGRICCSVIPLCRNALKAKNYSETKKETAIFLNDEIYKKSFSNFSMRQWPLYWKIYFWFAKRRLITPFVLMTRVATKYLRRRHR